MALVDTLQTARYMKYLSIIFVLIKITIKTNRNIQQ